MSGIYTNSPTSVAEHPVSFEYFDPNTGEDFQINAGVKIHGGISRSLNDPKHGLRIVFKGEYGSTELDYPVFADSDVETFDTLVLRCGSGDVWTWPGGSPDLAPYAAYYNDQWARYTQLAMGYPSPHSKFVQVYLNGLYWGIYNLAERPDHSFNAEYRGGDKDEWDVMHDNIAQNGTRVAWDQMKALADAGLDNEANYEAFAEYLNLTAFADYMILNAFGGNWDWPHHNWWAARNSADPNSKFMFFAWDSEQILEHEAIPYGWPGCGSVNCNIHELLPMVDPVGVWGTGQHSPGYLYLKLRDNSKFRYLMGDRVHRHLFNDGVLTTDPAKNRYRAMRDNLMLPIVSESARWGDSFGVNYTRNDYWLPNVNTVINDYFPYRNGIVVEQFRQADLYPNVNAPVFNVNASYQHGGQVSDSDLISVTNPDGNGVIYYSIDGTDIDLWPDVLIEVGAAKKVLFPTVSNPSGDAWRSDPLFDDSGWNDSNYVHISGRRGAIGYERGSGYQSYISYDVSNMYDNTGTCYIRIPFSLSTETLNSITSLVLKAMYDDAFVAYLNGHEVVRTDLVPENPVWNSEATSFRPIDPTTFDRFDISSFIPYLNVGDNILAIHGLNGPKTSSDFLMSVELESEKVVGGPGLLVYTAPFTLDKSATLKSRILYDNEWSALNEARFAVGDVVNNLKITELMYHPDDINGVDLGTEFVELKNIGGDTLNLNFVKFTDGIDFTFSDTTIVPGEYIVVVEDISAFENYYGQGVVTISGQYEGHLDNSGERITLTDSIGQVANNFKYKDGWFDTTDGGGFSLTLIDSTNTDPNNWAEKEFWRPSAMVGGSPGENDEGQVPNPGDIVINEVLAHSDTLLYDWIELHNTTGEVINIGGWFLSDSDADDPNRMKYEIAAGTTINPGDYIVFYENLHFGNPANPGIPFALSENGETVYLRSGLGGVLTGYSEEESFGASVGDTAFGRYYKASTDSYNFVAMAFNTPGTANAYPKVGPIVINEIMYHPTDTNGDAEYIEILNISDSSVTLYDFTTNEPWKMTDGIEYLFPSVTKLTLAAGEYFLIIKDLAAFTTQYGSPVCGYAEWTLGSLSNGGEKLEISMPGDVDGLGVRQYIRIDRVSYSDGAEVGDPWPSEPDGAGMSLTRVVPADYGNDVANWQASAPTPSPGE